MWCLLALIAITAASPAPSFGPLPALHPAWNIIGGDEVAAPGQWPWMSSLQTKYGHHCGCSYIGGHWALTAAHCVNGWDASLMYVMVGAHDIQTLEQGKPEKIPLDLIMMHEHYGQGSAFHANDIALVRMERVPELNDYVAPAKLAPNDNETYEAYDCYVTGWGDLGHGCMPNILKEANTNVISGEKCESVFIGIEITDKVVCFRDCPDLDSGSFRGDSGGPGQCFKDGEWIQVGLTSFGEQTGHPFFPAVYTRISAYYDWIMLNTNNLS